jgi:hypothetical protein
MGILPMNPVMGPAKSGMPRLQTSTAPPRVRLLLSGVLYGCRATGSVVARKCNAAPPRRGSREGVSPSHGNHRGNMFHPGAIEPGARCLPPLAGQDAGGTARETTPLHSSVTNDRRSDASPLKRSHTAATRSSLTSPLSKCYMKTVMVDRLFPSSVGCER